MTGQRRKVLWDGKTTTTKHDTQHYATQIPDQCQVENTYGGGLSAVTTKVAKVPNQPANQSRGEGKQYRALRVPKPARIFQRINIKVSRHIKTIPQ